MTHLFELDEGPLGPDYGPRCAFPDCPSISFEGPWCVLHRPRHGHALPPDVARLIGPTGQWAKEER